MPRILDLIAVAVVALVVLLPKASVDARPALDGEPLELDRVAEEQDDLFRQPDDVEAALKLADSYLSFMRADWALATLDRFSTGNDARVHLALATAHAERLEAKEVVAECDAVDRACAQAKATCPEGVQTKSGLLRDAMQALVDGKIDPAKDPQAAKDAVYKALHPSRFNITFRPQAPPKTPSQK